ncbi:hypothetical protein FTW19_06390 [Terriglobus albidus]|uniref:Uncharacterized protein n=1 Tax=Terriglobus albidus TaxID=1592106 RepID=A0A5B9EBK6_9BACT|nr:hypothetical protein [Terriglobus albidus]QEE27657.1 hypothetical protein FTW19_06390 [Terriglobus albidus]
MGMLGAIFSSWFPSQAEENAAFGRVVTDQMPYLFAGAGAKLLPLYGPNRRATGGVLVTAELDDLRFQFTSFRGELCCYVVVLAEPIELHRLIQGLHWSSWSELDEYLRYRLPDLRAAVAELGA